MPDEGWKTYFVPYKSLYDKIVTMVTKTYYDLIVWQKALDLTTLIYSITEKLPKEEIHTLSGGMRKAAVAIPSNIANGQTRGSKQEFIQSLLVAKGAKAELETQLLLCVRIGYLTDEDISEALTQVEEVGKMMSALIRSLTIEPQPL